MNPSSEKLVNIIQGDFFISDDPNSILTTVLGSCISVCLFDTNRAIGGMNHFLLAERDGAQGESVRYGAYAMELLINGLLKSGAKRENLKAKVFGGASMIETLRDIGGANTVFTRKFLSDEGIPCLAESVGGSSARRIRFWPTTGKVKQLVVSGSLDKVDPIAPRPKPITHEHEITLF